MKTDNDYRGRYEWKSKYIDKGVINQIWCEGLYLFVLLISSYVIIYLNYKGTLTQDKVLTSVIYVIASGLLGGVVFSIKFFYHIIAKGYWNQDRLAWRLLSPFVAISMSFVVGMLVNSRILEGVVSKSEISGYIALGFLSGYFADDAARKMKDVAMVIFGNDSNSDS